MFFNCNFKFLIEIKGSIVILKIFGLIGHKIYEISLIGNSYHFFGFEYSRTVQGVFLFITCIIL